jgi:hypothetical protein
MRCAVRTRREEVARNRVSQTRHHAITHNTTQRSESMLMTLIPLPHRTRNMTAVSLEEEKVKGGCIPREEEEFAGAFGRARAPRVISQETGGVHTRTQTGHGDGTPIRRQHCRSAANHTQMQATRNGATNKHKKHTSTEFRRRPHHTPHLKCTRRSQASARLTVGVDRGLRLELGVRKRRQLVVTGVCVRHLTWGTGKRWCEAGSFSLSLLS